MRVHHLLVLILALATAGQAAAQAPGRGGPSAPPPVIVEAVKTGDVTPRFEYLGRVEAIETVSLRARVEGFLETRNFTEGARVNSGDLLFRLEPDPYEAVVAQREAELAGAEATLKNARQTVERQRDLVKRNVTAQATLDEAEAAIGTAEAQVQIARAALRAARLQLAYTQIRTPISGVVGAAAYDVGNLVSPSSDPLATVTSIDPVHVTFGVSETVLLEARRSGIDLENPPVSPTIRLSDGSVYESEGRITFLNPTVDRQTDTILVRAEFPNPNRLLWPGQFVTVILRAKKTETAVLAPQTAVLQDRKGYYVITVDAEDVARKRDLIVDGSFDGSWRVIEGLSEGERIVTQGLQKVQLGQKVDPVQPAPRGDVK